MKVAIVGSREGFTEQEVYSKLWVLLANFTTDGTIISGGAPGVDQYVKTFANNFGCHFIEVRPINTQKVSYLMRNVEMITMADSIIAFWNGKSRGTKFVIDYATARGKELHVINKLNGDSIGAR